MLASSVQSSDNKKMKSKTYICSDCDKAFTSKFNLHRHIDCIHLKSSRFPCEVCGKTLTSKQNFIQHMHIHTGAKPLICSTCGQHFRQGSLLSAHRKLHRVIISIPKATFHVEDHAIMEIFKCSANCPEDAMYQCADDNQCICSTHLRKSHLRHKFKAIPKEEVAMRRSLVARLNADLHCMGQDGLTEELTEEINRSIRSAADSFKDLLEDWVSVHREQLLNLQHSLESSDSSLWPSAVHRVLTALATDYSAPLLSYQLELFPLRVELSRPAIKQVETPQEEVKHTDEIVTRFHELLQSGNANFFFQDNRARFMPEISRMWDSQALSNLCIKNPARDIDLIALLLLVVKTTTTRQLVITRCGFTQSNSKCLSEALRRTKSEIRTLDISNNDLRDEGLAEVATGLKEMRTLGLLAVRSAGLTDASISLLKAMKGVRLDLVGNRFSVEGRNALLAANPETKL